MNKKHAQQLAKELEEAGFLAHYEVRVHDPEQIYRVTVEKNIRFSTGISCDHCQNRIICLVNQRLMSIMPIIATATLNMNIKDKLLNTLGIRCKRFQR